MFFGTKYPIFGKFLLLRNLGRGSLVVTPARWLEPILRRAKNDADRSRTRHATKCEYAGNFR
jgi:hypothetical protein